MTLYSCTSHSTHAPTDQRWLVGCRDCLVEEYSGSTDFFRQKHLNDPAFPPVPGATRFIPDPRTSRVTIESSGEEFLLDSPKAFIEHWMSSERASLKWNTRHNTPNVLVPEVGYGVTGSGTTVLGTHSSQVTGLLVAKAFSSDAHPYPVNPGLAASDLSDWLWKCDCGALAPQGALQCLACQQRRAAAT